MKTIMAMRTNACSAADVGALSDKDNEALINWTQSLESNLMRIAKERGYLGPST